MIFIRDKHPQIDDNSWILFAHDLKRGWRFHVSYDVETLAATHYQGADLTA